MLFYCQAGAYAAKKKKPIWQKSRKEKETNHKIKKIYNNYHNALYKWVKSEEFSRGNPPGPHPHLFRNPHLPKINPAYVPAVKESNNKTK